MLKVSSGIYKGYKIYTNNLNKENVRPTTTKVRLAIFNILGQYFENGNFLDLYGGSGIMTFEFISRGINKATYIDNDYKCFYNFKKNCKKFKGSYFLNSFLIDSQFFLRKTNDEYDYIFIDAPYKINIIKESFCTILQRKILKKDGCIIFEISDKFFKIENLSFIKDKIFLCRSYGNVRIIILKNIYD